MHNATLSNKTLNVDLNPEIILNALTSNMREGYLQNNQLEQTISEIVRFYRNYFG